MADKKKKTIIVPMIVCVILGLAVFLITILNRDNKIAATLNETLPMGEVHEVNPNSKCIMENDRFALSLDEQTLGITVLDKVNQTEFFSTQNYTEGNQMWNSFCGSGVTIEFYKSGSVIPTSVSTVNELPETMIQYYPDGFDANLYFTNYDFEMQLQVRLNESGVKVFVPGDSIVEGEEHKVGAIWLYPMFGSTELGEEEGYMLIPEGAGALIDLQDNKGKFKTPYSKRVYGDNVGVDVAQTNYYNIPVVTAPEQITMPVFGVVYTEKKSGFLGVITEGDYNAELKAYPNGVTTPYNWVTSRFVIRDIYTKQTAKTSGVPTFEPKGDIRDLGIQYLFVNNEEADYTGLAIKYQEYLVETGDLDKKADTFKIKLDFLGADSQKWFIFNQVVPMTTIEDVGAIIEDLRENNVTDIVPVYFGWQDKGVTLNYGSLDVTVESKLGNKKDLEKLISELEEQGITLALKQELLLANTTELYNTAQDIVKGVNQVIVEVPTYQKLYESMYYMTPVRSFELANRFLDNYENMPVEKLSLSGITNNIFSYYSDKETYSRQECATQHKKVVELLSDKNLGMESPNAYMWSNMDEYYDMSLTTSNYNYIAEEVPFMPIVLRGYIPYWAAYANFEANETKYFLKMLEYGAYPTFLITNESPVELRNTNSSYIYTSEYDVLEEKIVKYYEEIGAVLKQVEGIGINNHELIAENVVKVEYDNDITVIINYSDKSIEYEGIVVSALSYKLVQ